MLVSLLVTLLISSSLALPQVHELQSSVQYNGTIEQYTGTDPQYGFELDYFKIWVPHSVLKVRVDFESENNCSTPVVRTLGLPCPNIYPYNQVGPICYLDSRNFTTPAEFSVYRSPLEPFQFVTENYWYFGVGRTKEAFNSMSCTYSLKVSVEKCPSDDQIDADGLGEADRCTTLNSIPQLTSLQTLSGIDTNYAFKVPIPAGTGSLEITFNSTAKLTIVGKSLAPAGVVLAPLGANQVSTTVRTVPGTVPTVYTYKSVATAPRSGMFYVLVRKNPSNDTEIFNFTMRITLNACQDGTAGPLCAGALETELDNHRVLAEQFSSQVWAFDIPQPTNFTVTFSVARIGNNTDPLGFAYIFWKKGGYAYDSPGHGYDNKPYMGTIAVLVNKINGFIIFDHDTVEPGIYYLTVYANNFTDYTINPRVTTSTTDGYRPTTTSSGSGQGYSGQSFSLTIGVPITGSSSTGTTESATTTPSFIKDAAGQVWPCFLLLISAVVAVIAML